MAIALIGHAKAVGANGGTTVAFDASAANFVANVVAGSNSTPPTPSDSQSNSYVGLTRRPAAFGGSRVWYKASPGVGAAMTFSVGGTGLGNGIYAAAFSGVAVTSPVDQEAGNASASPATTVQPGSLTPSVPGCLILVGWSIDAGATVAIDSGFTILDQANFVGGASYGGGLAYLIQTSAAPVNPTITVSGGLPDISIVMVAVKPAPSSLRRTGQLGHCGDLGRLA